MAVHSPLNKSRKQEHGEEETDERDEYAGVGRSELGAQRHHSSANESQSPPCPFFNCHSNDVHQIRTNHRNQYERHNPEGEPSRVSREAAKRVYSCLENQIRSKCYEHRCRKEKQNSCANGYANHLQDWNESGEVNVQWRCHHQDQRARAQHNKEDDPLSGGVIHFWKQ